MLFPLVAGIPNSDLTVRHIHTTSGHLGISGAAGSHLLPRPHQNQQDIGMMGKPFSQYPADPLVTSGLEELRGSFAVSVYMIISDQFQSVCTPDVLK